MERESAIAITGLGLITCLGGSPEETWAGVVAGKRGFGPLPGLEQRPAIEKGGGQAVELPPTASANLPRAARYLRWAVEQALRMRGPGGPPPNRCGAIFGTTLHGMSAGGRFFRSDDARELRDFLAGSVAQRALEGLGIGGPVLTTCSACSSGLGSIALAVTLLRTGELDRVVAGGYDCVSEYAYAGFDSLRLVAAGAPRPFAAGRDGMKIAEGYGVFVLERAHDADAGNIIACVAGFGESSDASHLTQPHPDGEGAARAIRAALSDAGVEPGGVDMIAAHATATANNDAAEYGALRSAFGGALASVPVVAFKSHVGHTLGGAGAIELALSALARLHGRVPPTAGNDPVDTGFAGLYLVRERAMDRPVRTTVNMSLGFGGANTCVVLSGPPAVRARAAQPDAGAETDPVITGIGVVVPGAAGNSAFLGLVGSVGRAPLTLDTGPIPEAAFAHLINARRTRRMSDYAKLTLAAAASACEDAGTDSFPGFFEECSGILGTTHGASSFCEAFYGQIVREGMAAANPVLFAEGVPNVGAAQLSMALGIKGGCQTIIGTRCAGLDALRLAALRIREGRWQRALVGAAEEYSAVVNRAYGACGLYGGDTTREPGGFVTGSGSVMLVIESRGSALRRGARIRGAVGGGAWSSGQDADSALAEVMARATGAAMVVTALSNTRADRASARAIERASTGTRLRPWSVYGLIPELFSVGPLAGIAAVLLGEPMPGCAGCAPGESIVVIGTEFAGAATLVRLERA